MAKTKKTTKNKTSKTTTKQSKTIGILHSGTGGRHDKGITALLKSLKQAGYSVGTNLTIAPKRIPLWSHDDPKELRDNADTLAGIHGIDLIIAAGGSASTDEVARATNLRINGVFTSFSKKISPATNMTGVCARTTELDVFRLTNLYNLVQPQPNATFGVLENQKRSGYDPIPLKDEGNRLHLNLDRVSVYKLPGETGKDVVSRIKDAFARWKSNGVKAALVCADPIFNDHRKEALAAAKANGVATMHQWREFKDEGGYASFGTSLIEAYQKAGTIAGHVLDGTAPSAIPVYVLGNLALSINRATAKRLHLPPKP